MEISPDFQQLWVARGRTTKPTLVPPQLNTDYIRKGVLVLLGSIVGELVRSNELTDIEEILVQYT